MTAVHLCSASCILVVALAGCGSSTSSDTDGGGGNDTDASTIPASCGNGTVDDPREECDDGNDNRFDGCRPDCTTVAPIQPDAMAWKYFEIPGTKCIDGTPAGFGVNYNPSSTKLVIYLEGGGACFNNLCESLHTWGPNLPTPGGIFDRTNTANPLRDWSWVYVPYCSGDVYAGQAETMLGGKLRYFYGHSNITAFLERIVPTFDTVDQVLLTGSSAGGFGATLNFPQTQRAFGSVPVVWIDDSAPPMSTTVYPPCLQQTWQAVWRLDRTVLAECGAACDDPSAFSEDLFDHIRATFPTMRGGLYSTLSDQTIRAFAGYGWTDGYDTCNGASNAVSAAVYQQGLGEVRTKLMDTPGLGSFYISGTSHTRLRASSFYTTQVGTTTLPQWIANTLAGTTTHVGP